MIADYFQDEYTTLFVCSFDSHVCGPLLHDVKTTDLANFVSYTYIYIYLFIYTYNFGVQKETTETSHTLQMIARLKYIYYCVQLWPVCMHVRTM
jgi:hypothetical protein